ncbi:MAG: nicotinate-nucleotide adenylyltransferase [Dissulfurispiraceae bacterium]
MRLGIFGGTFNPIHSAHLRTAEEVGYKLGLDKVIFVPSGNPPLKEQGTVEASHRFAMATLAAASNKGFIISDLEAGKKGKSYTVDTLRMFHKNYPGAELFFILGIDAFLDMPKWRQPERLTGITDFIIVSRPGFSFDAVAKSPYIQSVESSAGAYALCSLKSGRRAFLVPVTRLDISSTGIRHLIKQKKSIKYLLPPSVERYIKKNKLYDK